MKWSIWTSLLLAGFLVPVSVLVACAPQDATQEVATAEVPAISGANLEAVEEAVEEAEQEAKDAQADAGMPAAVEGTATDPGDESELPDVAAPSS